MSRVLVYIGLGANLNNPTHQLIQAIMAIEQIPGIEVTQCSSFYETEPVGYKDQPNFINAVIAVVTEISAFALLKKLQEIENQQGRIRDAMNRNGPRTIDLDILLYGKERIKTPELTVPHPRMHERQFVLQPLGELFDGVT